MKEELEKSLKDKNIWIDKLEYKKGELNIILDSSDVLDIDKIVEATKIINKVLDEKDYIKEKYMLDVSSKEKGGN
ncbi:MAG: hypothetical protein Q4C29_01815 [bacterium]|nr:hypothetical protein [bacterium]